MGGGPMGAMGMPVQKAKNFKATLKRLISYLKPHRTRLILVLFLAVASTTFTILAPKVMSKGMNKLQDSYMASTMLKNLAKGQQMAIDGINAKLIEGQKRAADAGSGMDAATIRPAPENMKDIQEFLGLPLLDTVKDPDQKADISRRIIDLGDKLKGVMGETAATPGSEIKFTREQLDAAIQAIHETNGEYDFNYIGRIVLTLIAMFLVSSLFSLIMGLVMSGVAQNTVRDLRREVDVKLSRLPLKYFDMHPHGDILSRVTNDVDTVSGTLQQSLTQIITSVITILGYIIMMLTISPILTLIVLATLPLYVLTTMTIAKKSQKYFAAQQKDHILQHAHYSNSQYC